MYKFSILFQYKYIDNIFIFFIGKNKYSIEVTNEEKEKIIYFINKYLGDCFSTENFYEICNFSKKENYLNFFIKTKIIIDFQKGNIDEIINWSNLGYNPSLLYNHLGEKEAFILCKNQHILGNNKIIKKENGILFNFLKKRQTYRNFKNIKDSKKDILYLFRCMYGNIRENIYMNFNFTHKTTPSGGAFFPLNIYFFKFYKKSINLYNFDGNGLNYIKKVLNKKEFIQNNILDNPSLDFENSIGLVVILSNLKYVGEKYGAKAYQLSLLEGGHISQNFLIAGIEKGYGTCELGGVYENNLIKECGKYDGNHIFINSILFGKI